MKTLWILREPPKRFDRFADFATEPKPISAQVVADASRTASMIALEFRTPTVRIETHKMFKADFRCRA